MSVLIKYMAMPKGCIYANDKDQTEYCPLLNHDDVPFCQYIENEPEIAIGIDERPVYCPLFDVPEPCQDAVSRQAAIDVTTETVFVEYEDGDPRKEESIILQTKAAIRDRIKALPPVQPKRGKWIERESGTEDKENGFETVIVCSCCDFPATTFYSEDCESRTQIRTDFCPNCGADMRGEADGC